MPSPRSGSFTKMHLARLSFILTPSYPSRISRTRLSTTSKALSSTWTRSDIPNQPFTGSYEVGGPTRGPLGEASSHGAPRIVPKRLKEYLDKYVIGQERSKKMLSVAVYMHYLRVQELQRREEEEQLRLTREARKRNIMYRDRLQSEEDSQRESRIGRLNAEYGEEQDLKESATMQTSRYTPMVNTPPPSPLEDDSPIALEKSNVMVLGPTGVGKTLIVKTLARALEVPFSMSDCTPFTQAGYIGEDAEVCVQRLLAAADYDVARAEYGIICLDEVDKLAVNRSTNGRDVGGEGVQQALLKIIEGTTLQITAKHEHKVNPRTPNAPTFNNMSPQPPQKPETYTIRTDNILFIFTGAFVGLQKMVMDRVVKTSGSIGFGADVRPPMTLNHQMTLSETDAHVYYRHLPFYADRASTPLSDAEPYNPLDLTTPADLQTFGLIPEFLGRIPITTALAPLSINSLLRVLTEPRNSIVAQYIHSFATFNADLRFTTPALHAIAETAFKLGTGARGVRSAVEALLGEAMYEVPGSSVRYVLVTRKSAVREERVLYFSRGQGPLFRKEAEREEAEWDGGKVQENVVGDEPEGEITSFEEFRERAGSGM